MLRPSADSVTPTHIAEGKSLYLKSADSSVNLIYEIPSPWPLDWPAIKYPSSPCCGLVKLRHKINFHNNLKFLKVRNLK